MSRRIAIRFMLSLLLLLSQQMALSHAISHWAGSAHSQQAAEEDSSLSAAVAQDDTCDKCLSFANLAGAIGADPFRFDPAQATQLAITGPLKNGPFSTARAAFQPRAPPAPA